MARRNRRDSSAGLPARRTRGRSRGGASFPVAPPRAELPRGYSKVLAEIKRRIRQERVRVVLADDHPIVRAGLRHILGSKGGIEVVSEVGDGRSLLREVEAPKPKLDRAACGRLGCSNYILDRPGMP